jgi:type IV pilus assembly protein PilW
MLDAMTRRAPLARPGHSPSRRRMAGLSLIELMISITLGMMILSGVAFVFVNASSSRNEVERTSRQIENGRYAVEVIADDLRLAGFYGELKVSAVGTPTEVPFGPTHDQCSLDPTKWNNWIKLHVQGFDNGADFNKTTTVACALADLKAGTDILLIRRARTCVAGSTGCDAAVDLKPYVQVSLCASEVATHKLGIRGTETFNLKTKACTTATAGLREYLVRIYYISTNNGSGVSVPTLKRMELGLSGGALTWVATPLVEGIEELNIEYGVDTNGDGSPDSYVAVPAATVAEWTKVVAVQFYILARNLDKSPDYTLSKTYNLGLGKTPVTVADGYRRHVYSTLVRLNNPAGRLDVPTAAP